MKRASNRYIAPSSPISGFFRKSDPHDEGNPMSTPFPHPPDASSRRAMSPGAKRKSGRSPHSTIPNESISQSRSGTLVDSGATMLNVEPVKSFPDATTPS